MVSSASTRIFRVLALVAIAGCAGTEGPTGVTLTISSNQVQARGLLIDRFRIRADVEGEPTSEVAVAIDGRTADTTETVNLKFRKRNAGRVVFIEVDALSGDQEIAFGRAEAELKKHELVRADVVLSTCAAAEGDFCEGVELVSCDMVTDETVRTTCSFGCNPDTTQCNVCLPGTIACQDRERVACDDSGNILSREDCAALDVGCVRGACDPTGCSTVDLADSDPCDDGEYCTLGESCTGGVCGGGITRDCDDDNVCTTDACNEATDTCDTLAVADGTICEDGSFCTQGDRCASGACRPGTTDPCDDGNACTADTCDDTLDTCDSACEAAGTRCLDDAREVECDGACKTLTSLICGFGCNLTRDECNACQPSVASCRPDLSLLCNAEVSCSADGQVQTITCCSSNRCTCDGARCLEDECSLAPDVSAGGSFLGDTCDDADNIPGDCNPGGPACLPVGSGGRPEELFRFTLDDAATTSTFYDVVLDTTGSSLDTALRLSTVCGSETRQITTANVCPAASADDIPRETCFDGVGPELMRLCGLAEGTYFGAVDGAVGTCGGYDLDVTITPVDLDTSEDAGNISQGGRFTGNTCGLTDDFQFANTIGASGCGGLGDCTSSDCPGCSAGAATDCAFSLSDTESLCSHSGRSGRDAVFYLALEVDSGVDISTQGSSFDTVLYLMESGPTGASPPGGARICNDDCWVADGPSHIQTTLPAGLYYVYLDGANTSCGDYVLDVSVSPAATCPNLACEPPFENCDTCPLDCPCPNCGDSTVQPSQGEACDDGGTSPGDGCSPTCTEELGFSCTGSPSVCARQYESCPGIAIPDGDLTGITETITVPDVCTLTDVTIDVDITHAYRGDIFLELSSPDGTTLLLKTTGIDNSNNLVGNYDLDLVPEGGSMDVFDGENANGVWSLHLVDDLVTLAGALRCWAVNVTCP